MASTHFRQGFAFFWCRRQGLPSDWDHTHLAAGTFSTGGQIPPHLLEMQNVATPSGYQEVPGLSQSETAS